MVDAVWLLSVAFKNISSRKTRTLLTVAGIAVGVALLFSLVALVNGVEAQSTAMIRSLTSADIVLRNVTIPGSTGVATQVPGQGPQLMWGTVFSRINESVLPVIKSLSGIYAVTPVLSIQASLNRTSITLQGIIPGEYESVTGGLNIVNGGDFSCYDCPEAIIGKSLMDRLNITVGDSIIITVNNTQVNLSVVGVYESGLQFFEVTNVYVPLYFLQNITGSAGYVSEVLIKLENPSSAQEIASTIQSVFPGLRVVLQTSQVQQASQLISTLTTFFLTIGLIAVIAGGFGVANTMLISVFERMREIGVLRAIGTSSKTILILFLTEALILGLAGGATGVVLGSALAYILPAYFPLQRASTILPGARSLGGTTQQLTRALITPVITWDIVVLALAIGVCVSIIAGLYPAWRASRVKPVEVIRYA
jgi:putative ABC transport system permease protein